MIKIIKLVYKNNKKFQIKKKLIFKNKLVKKIVYYNKINKYLKLYKKRIYKNSHKIMYYKIKNKKN